MIAEIVAPFGDESRAMTRVCFEPDFDASALRWPPTRSRIAHIAADMCWTHSHAAVVTNSLHKKTGKAHCWHGRQTKELRGMQRLHEGGG